MPTGLDIALAPEFLDEGSREERAAFGLFTIRANGLALTEGFDFFTRGYRPGPLVSGYHVAEWLAWNWWRLRWVPQSVSADWWRAHRMTSIGEGYVWPNLTIYSDGIRTALISRPSSRPDAKPFRYVGAHPSVIPAELFEQAVDAFIPQVMGRLRESGIGGSNLDLVWKDVLAERADPDLAKRRRIEALLGRDADEGDDNAVETLLADAGTLGAQAVDELAADHPQGGELLTAQALRTIAMHSGFEASLADIVRLKAVTGLSRPGDVPAWRVGAVAAKALRDQERLGIDPIANDLLAKMAGVPERALTYGRKTAARSGSVISFALDEGAAKSRVVLRSSWETSRRFELARLLGDRILNAGDARLFPATRSHTYRQKMQRSFAAEFLSPFEAVDAMLDGDYSEENRQDVAADFNVSEFTIRTLLVNHRRLEREELEEEEDTAAA